jgi:hypothetical protein
MSWTFQEFDETPAGAIVELLEIWRIDGVMKNKPAK